VCCKESIETRIRADVVDDIVGSDIGEKVRELPPFGLESHPVPSGDCRGRCRERDINVTYREGVTAAKKPKFILQPPGCFVD
jgi:hypothetical protein